MGAFFGAVVGAGYERDGEPKAALVAELKDELERDLGWARERMERAFDLLALPPRAQFAPPGEPFRLEDLYPWRFNRALSYVRRPLIVRPSANGDEVVWGVRHCYTAHQSLIRIDSGCGTGQVFGDLTCDCAGQLDRSLALIAEHGSGMVIHIPRQDGRGLGLPFKLATLAVQNRLGLDTVEASAALDPDGIARDQRTYAGALAILRFFEVRNDTPVHLLSNNPDKLKIFQENGYVNAHLSAITVVPTEHTFHHLRAKQRHFRHIGLVSDSSE